MTKGFEDASWISFAWRGAGRSDAARLLLEIASDIFGNDGSGSFLSFICWDCGAGLGRVQVKSSGILCHLSLSLKREPVNGQQKARRSFYAGAGLCCV